MALWGTGDSRWIVEDRSDGTNVNNWHWKEKNATNWSIEKVNSLIKPVRVENDTFAVEVSELKVTGDAACHNRKGKIRCVFDLELEIKWKASLKATKAKAIKGKIDVTNFMPPNLAEKPKDSFIAEIDVSCETSDETARKALEFVKADGVAMIKQKMTDYVSALEVWASDLILPTMTNDLKLTDTTSGSNANESSQQRADSASSQKPAAQSQSQPKSVGVKIPTRSYEYSESFNCAPSDLYACFTQKDLLSAFSRGPAQCETERGGRFALYGGAVSGEFESLEPSSSLIMRWRVRNWPEAIFSKVELRFEECDDGCQLTLSQSGIPEQQYESTCEGWTNYYFVPIRQTFGYGVRL